MFIMFVYTTYMFIYSLYILYRYMICMLFATYANLIFDISTSDNIRICDNGTPNSFIPQIISIRGTPNHSENHVDYIAHNHSSIHWQNIDKNWHLNACHFLTQNYMTSLKCHFLKNNYMDFAEILFEDAKLMLIKVL